MPSTAAVFLRGDTVVCTTLPAATPGDVRVRVSIDGGSTWSSDTSAPSFTFYEPARPPTLARLDPTYLDVASIEPLRLELVGENFAPTGPAKLQCGFGQQAPTDASFIASGRLGCVAPRTSQATLVVHARHDGATWDEQGRTLVLYNSSRPPIVSALVPAALPIHPSPAHTSSLGDGALDAAFSGAEVAAAGGGALLAVHGANFHPAQGGASCTFSPLAEAEDRTVVRTTATFVSPSRMDCRAPAIHRPATLRVSIDFSDRPLTSTRAPTDGDDAPSAASSSTISISDELEPSDANTARLTYFDPAAPPRVLATSPSYAEVHAGVSVQVQGSNLSPAEGAAPNQLLCRFGEMQVPASFATRVKVSCRSPLGAAPGTVDLVTSSDGGESWAPSDARFTFYDLSRPLALHAVTPDSA